MSAETIIDSRSGDKPIEGKPGQVTPGMDMRQRMGIRAATKPPEEKKEPELPPDNEGLPPKDPRSGRFVKAKAKKKVAEPITKDDIASIATSVATAAVKATQIREEPKVVDPLLGLADDDRDTHRILLKMEELGPTNKGKAAAFLKATKALADHKEEWEKANRGKKFNIEDPEHEEFVRDHEVTWSERDFSRALVKLETEVETQSKIKPLQDKLAAKEQEEQDRGRAAQIAPKVANHQRATAMVLFQQLGDDFKNVLDEGGNLNQEEAKKLADSSPVIGQVFGLAADTEAVAGELMRIANGVSKLDYKAVEEERKRMRAGLPMLNALNNLHARVFEFVGEQEQLMLEQPDANQIDDKGRQFVTSAQFDKLKDDERGDYWTFNDADLSLLYAANNAELAKKIIENDERVFNARAASRGYAVQNNPPPRQVVPPKPPVTTAPKRHTSPAGGGTARIGGIKQNGNSSLNALKKSMGL